MASNLQNINKEIQIFYGKNGKVSPLPATGNFTITNTQQVPDLIKKFVDYVRENFTNPDKFTAESFNYVQDIIARIDPNIQVTVVTPDGNETQMSLQRALIEILGKECQQYIVQRPDLISNLRTPLVEKIKFECLSNALPLINPKVFSEISKARIDELNNLPADKLQNLYDLQKKELAKNPNLTNDLRTKLGLASAGIISAAAIASAANNTPVSEISANIPSVTELPVTVVSTNNTAAKEAVAKSVAANNAAAKSVAANNSAVKSVVANNSAAKTVAANNAANNASAKAVATNNAAAKAVAANNASAKSVAANNSAAKTVVANNAAKTVIANNTAAKTVVANNAAAKTVIANNTPSKTASVNNAAAKETIAKTVAVNNTAAKTVSVNNTAAKIAATTGIAAVATTATPKINKLPVIEGNIGPSTETLINQSVNPDIKDIIQQIKSHLGKMDEAAKIGFDDNSKNTVLQIGNNRITTDCMIYYMSGRDNTLMPPAGDDCDGQIKNYLINSQINLSELIKISGDFKVDSDFYKNLYNFNISLANYVTENPKFAQASYQSQLNILGALKEFFGETIIYLGDYMDKHKVIDDNLLTSSYNLLLLLNSFVYKRANIGRNTDELRETYKKLTDAINKNILLYKRIDPTQFKFEATEENKQLADDISKLTEELKKRLRELEKQYVQLEKNVDIINNQKDKIINIVNSKDILDLSEKLRKTQTV